MAHSVWLIGAGRRGIRLAGNLKCTFDTYTLIPCLRFCCTSYNQILRAGTLVILTRHVQHKYSRSPPRKAAIRVQLQFTYVLKLLADSLKSVLQNTLEDPHNSYPCHMQALVFQSHVSYAIHAHAGDFTTPIICKLGISRKIYAWQSLNLHLKLQSFETIETLCCVCQEDSSSSESTTLLSWIPIIITKNILFLLVFCALVNMITYLIV